MRARVSLPEGLPARAGRRHARLVHASGRPLHGRVPRRCAKHSLLEICRTPDLATEVTLQPVAASRSTRRSCFSDLLLPLEPMGLPFDFVKGEGPQIERPIESPADIDRAARSIRARRSAHVLEAIRLVQRELPDACR